MTRIECTKCGELVETSATTFVAPYVCDACEHDTVLQDMKDGLGEASVEDSVDDSVDDTTNLIGDLTTQVEKYDNALTTANVLISDFNQKFTESQATVAERDETITNLVKRNIDLFIKSVDAEIQNAQARKLVVKLSMIAADQSLEINALARDLSSIKKENSHLRDLHREGIIRRSQSLDDYFAARKELRANKSRGLVARILNK